MGTDFGMLECRGVPAGDVGGTDDGGGARSKSTTMAQQFLDKTGHLPGRDNDEDRREEAREA